MVRLWSCLVVVRLFRVVYREEELRWSVLLDAADAAQPREPWLPYKSIQCTTAVSVCDAGCRVETVGGPAAYLRYTVLEYYSNY